MKRAVKIILVVIVLAAAAAGYVYYSSMPVAVDTVQVEQAEASTYFIETGNVKAQTTVSIYATRAGKIVDTPVKENDTVKAGDVICKLDDSDLADSIAQAQSQIAGYEAQKASLDDQQRSRVADLNASLSDLRGQLDNVTAQEKDYLAQTADQTQSANDQTKQANDAIAAGNAQIKAQLDAQQILINQDQTAYDQAEKSVSDAQLLLSGGAISQSDYDAIVAVRDAAKTALANAKAQIDVIKAGIKTPADLKDVKTFTDYYDAQKAALNDKIAVVRRQIGQDFSGSMRQYYDTLVAGQEQQIKSLQKNINDCTVTSPVAGTLTDLYIKDTNVVSVSSPVALIETERSRDIEVMVTTKEFPDIKPGQKVEITQSASSGDIVFGGAVTDIGTEAVSRTSSLGVSERVVKITVTPDSDAQASFLPGFSFDVKFFTYTAENQLIVPKTAAFKYTADKAAPGIVWLGEDMTGKPVADVDMVFDATDGVIKMRQVTLGRELSSDYVIDAGLEAGSVVVKDSSADNAKVGTKVKL